MAAIDQGFLDYLNLAAPGCSVNMALARAAKQTNAIKTVPLGQQCPSGYTQGRPNSSGLPPVSTINNICVISTPNTSQEAAVLPLSTQFMTCLQQRSAKPASVPVPAPIQAPTPVPVPSPVPAPATKSELPIWAIILIVIAAFLVVGGLIFMGIKLSQ